MRYQLVEDSPKTAENGRFQIIEEKEAPVKSALRTGYQVASGLAESSPLVFGPEIASTLASKAQFSSPEEALSYMQSLKAEEVPKEIERRKLGEQQIKAAFPTKEKLEKIVEEKTGFPTEAKTELQKGIKLASTAFGFKPGTLINKALAGGSAVGIREALVSQGMDSEKADAVSLLLSQLNPAKAAKAFSKTEPEKFVSGLEKPRAVESKFAEKGILTKSQQEDKLANLNKKAAELTKKSIEKKLPISRKIEEGFDFEKQFEDRFSKIKSLSEKHNPILEVEPIEDFMGETIKKYQGIPRPHEDARKVIKEVQSFAKNPFESSLANMIKIYRSNNKKIKSIYEKSRLLGTQDEYVDFLLDYNRAIGDSIRQTFPKDSEFVRMFDSANKDYAKYKNALKAQSILKPILGENPTPANLTKLYSDPKLQKRLSLSMGEEGANEVIQIAKDLKTARESIKKIPVKDFKEWEKIFPFSVFIPGFPEVKILAGSAVMHRLSKHALGIFLSNSKNRKAYSEALKAISDGNLKAYSKATKDLVSGSEESD